MNAPGDGNTLREQGVGTTEKNGYGKNLTILRRAISTRIWILQYSVEETRQAHAAANNKWRQVGCCIALSMFRLMEGRGL